MQRLSNDVPSLPEEPAPAGRVRKKGGTADEISEVSKTGCVEPSRIIAFCSEWDEILLGF